MNLKNKNIQTVIIVFPVLLLILFMIYNVKVSKNRWNNKNLEKRYTIAIIYEFKSPIKNAGAFKYKFHFKQKLYSSDFLLAKRIDFKNAEHTNRDKIITDILKLSPKELQEFVGKRYCVKFIKNYPKNSELLLDMPVPDSVVEAPLDGWDLIP